MTQDIPEIQKIDGKKFVYDYLCRAVKELYNFDLDAAEKKVAEDKKIFNQLIPPKTHLHNLYFNLCLNVFAVSKYLIRDHKPKDMKPPDFTEQVNRDLAAKFEAYAKEDESSILSEVQLEGPFLNVHFKPIYVGQIIDKILNRGFLNPLPEKEERTMIEYSQPNTHKTFHVGHMRNAALGNSLVRFYRHSGYPVVAVNYIGDVGTHIAKCLWYYLRFFPKKGSSVDEDVPEHLNRVEFLGEMYSSSVTKLSLDAYVKLPFPKFVFARVEATEPHPANPKWTVVDVFDGTETQRVVCGGRGFTTGQIVAYAPVGSKKGKIEVTQIDKKGVVSNGCILSEKELDLGEDNDLIRTFTSEDVGPLLSSEPVPGLSLTEGSRIADTDIPANKTVLEELKDRDQEVKQLLLRMEKGEEEITNLWKLTRQWCIEDFKDIYSWTDTHFDFDFHESDVGEEAKEIAYQAYKDGILVESNGAIGADLSSYNMPGTKQSLGFLVLITSAGTGLYATKDLALAKRKFDEFKVDRSIYVVDAGQSLHFQQVFQTLQLLGFKQASKCFHLAYGIVTLPDGKMSSRKGTVIYFSQLKREVTTFIRKEYLEKYRGVWSDEKIEETCRCISVATIKYGMLNQDNGRNIVFDLSEWASPIGNTGPYLLYAYTRTQSILREVQLTDEEKALVDYGLLSHPTEIKLMTILEEFADVVEKATETYKPSLMCIYLYTLCKQFSRWYDSCSTKNAETPALKATRLQLVDATGRVIHLGLDLLGITTVDYM